MCSVVWGTIPTLLRGTLYRNGPDIYDPKIAHPFDGDGRVDRVEFRDGKVKALSRHVETPHRRLERVANAKLFRHPFGTMAHAIAPMKHSANTAVAYHAGTLLALCESSVPYELDPETLETRGTHSLWGALGPLESVCAHTKRVGESLVALRIQYAPDSVRMRFAEIAQHGETSNDAACTIPAFALVHDFGVTDTHYVFFVPSCDFSAAEFLRGASAFDSITHTQGNTRAFTLDRRTGELRAFSTDARFLVTHVANAFSRASGEVVVDAIATDTLGRNVIPDTHFVRFVLSDHKCTFDRLHLVRTEFPTVRSQSVQNRFTYTCSFTKSWAKVDHLTRTTRLFHAVPNSLHFEPTFVPLGDREDDGLIVGFVLVNSVVHVGISHARTLAPVCVIEASQCNVLGLHSTWVGDSINASEH